jgi:hypothetical protein
MMSPSHCPVCKDPLLNEFSSDITKKEYFHKKCIKRPSHTFVCNDIEGNGATHIIFHVDGKIIAFLDDEGVQELAVTSLPGGSRISLPFFEPDLNNFHALLDKVKLCLTFA